MALFIRQQDNRSELQSRVAAELRERLRQSGEIVPAEPEESEYLQAHQTRTPGVVIVILSIVLLVVVVLWASKL